MAVPLFYQIDYTVADKHTEGIGRLHILFRRENPTTEKKDFELLPQRKQKGRFIGSVIGVFNLHPDQWWGEGEVKVYSDGDEQFATIVGTGSTVCQMYGDTVGAYLKSADLSGDGLDADGNPLPGSAGYKQMVTPS